MPPSFFPAPPPLSTSFGRGGGRVYQPLNTRMLLDLGEAHPVQSVRLWPSCNAQEECRISLLFRTDSREYTAREVYVYEGPLTRDTPIGPVFPPEWYETHGYARFIEVRARRPCRCVSWSVLDPESFPNLTWSLIQVRQALHDNEASFQRTRYFIPHEHEDKVLSQEEKNCDHDGDDDDDEAKKRNKN